MVGKSKPLVVRFIHNGNMIRTCDVSDDCHAHLPHVEIKGQVVALTIPCAANTALAPRKLRSGTNELLRREKKLLSGVKSIVKGREACQLAKTNPVPDVL